MKKKKIIFWAAVGCGVSLCAGIAAQGGILADAENSSGMAGNAFENYFVAGGSVRLVDDEHGAGIRFHVMMSEDDYAKNIKDGVTTGTLILPKSLLAEGGELTLEDTRAMNIDTTSVWESTTYSGATYKQSIAYVYNIPKENYGSDLYARGYVKSGDKIAYTAVSAPISMSWVAQDEYNDENSLLTAEQKQTLKETYVDFSVLYHVDGTAANVETAEYGSLLEKPQNPEKEGYRFAGWFDRSGDYEWDFSKNAVSGTVNLYAKFIKTYQVTFTDGTQTVVKEYDENAIIPESDIPNFTSVTLIHKGWKSKVDTTVTKNVTYTAMMFHPVKTLADFNAIGATTESLQGNYMLVSDIDAKDKAINTVAHNDTGKAFQGVFDGNGHTISNCTLTTATANKGFNCSLFGTVAASGVIRNLNVVNAVINTRFGGGIATLNWGTIENCFISATVTIATSTAVNPTGGIASKNAGGKIRNCVAVIKAGSGVTNACVGGIAGRTTNVNSVIENCYLYSETFEIFETSKSGDANDLRQTTNAQAVKTTEALKALDYSMFDSAIWDFSGEYPNVKVQG